MPPPLMIFFGACNLIVLGLALSRFGGRLARHLPLAALIGVQAFRLPLELVLHAWYEQGVLPVQMTYSGHNFDIVSGIGGLALGVGLGLLLTVMTIAVTSSPIPLRLYSNEPVLALANYVPYVWILPVCVCGALFAHVLTFRHLLNEPTRG